MVARTGSSGRAGGGGGRGRRWVASAVAATALTTAAVAAAALARAREESRRRRQLARALGARRKVADRLVERLMDDGRARALLLEAMGDLEHRATHDDLTGLPNRACLRDRLTQAILSGRRASGTTAVLLLDLDGFKRVNDSFGHALGDRVLQAVGPRITGVLRESDTLARLGGDEFCVLLPDVTGATEAAAVAGRIARALEEPFLVDGIAVGVGASCGIALAPTDGDTAAELLEAADVAMYAAKRTPSRGPVPFGTLDLRDPSAAGDRR